MAHSIPHTQQSPKQESAKARKKTAATFSLRKKLKQTPYFKASKLQLVAVSFFINLLSLALPLMLLQVYDRILAQQNISTLIMLMAGVGIAILLEAALKLARYYLTGWSAACFEHHASQIAMQHLAHAEIAAYQAQPTSHHIQRLQSITHLREFYAGQALISFVDVPFVVLFLAVIFYLAGPLVLIPLILLGIFIVAALWVGHHLKTYLYRRKEADNQKYDLLLRLFSQIHSIKALALEPFLQRRFETKQEAVTHANYHAARYAQSAHLVGHVMSQIALVCVVAFGALLVMRGQLSVGSLAACTLLTGRIMQPVARLLGLWTKLQHYRVAKKEVNALFQLPQQASANENISVLTQANIHIKDLEFSWPESKTPLFSIKNTTIQARSITAILGQKGRGKTSLLRLMMGAMQPQSGSIKMGALTIEAAHWGKDIAYIPQSGEIFQGTILQNLTLFAEDDPARYKAAKEVATSLGIDAFVAHLPQGYDTWLSDSDADPLPPGMKQRIAVARAFISGAHTLLFDDADKALDKEGYNLLFRLLGTYAKGKTLILATQDQNVLALATHLLEITAQGDLQPVTGDPSQAIAQFLQQSREGASA